MPYLTLVTTDGDALGTVELGRPEAGVGTPATTNTLSGRLAPHT